jgi:hypothetical protein
MTSDTALYIGEAGKMLGITPLIPGVTVAFVPAGEALVSDLWEPQSPVPNPATSAPANIFDGGDPPSNPIGALDGGTP